MRKNICREKILSELMRPEMIFSAAGPHTGDILDKTMEKKISDMENCGFCLWAVASLPKGLINNFRGKDELIAILVQNKKGNSDTKGGYCAYGTDDPDVKIPSNMNKVTCGKSSYAFVVKEIIKITDGENFNRTQYEKVSHLNGQEFGRFDPEIKWKPYKGYFAEYALVLKPPFVVKLTDIRKL